MGSFFGLLVTILVLLSAMAAIPPFVFWAIDMGCSPWVMALYVPAVTAVALLAGFIADLALWAATEIYERIAP